MNFEELTARARKVVRPADLNASTSVGYVGAALLTDRGHVYTGVNLDLYCSVGFCAEHSAAAAMVTAGEFRVVKMVAVNAEGNILPPCGRCRELISQLIAPEATQAVMDPDGYTPRARRVLERAAQAARAAGAERVSMEPDEDRTDFRI